MTNRDQNCDSQTPVDTDAGEPGLLLDVQSAIARIEVRIEQAVTLLDIGEGFMRSPPNSLAVLAALGCATECEADVSDLVDFLPGMHTRPDAELPERQRFDLATQLLTRYAEIQGRIRLAVDGEWNLFEEPADFGEWQQAMEWYQHCFRCRANLRAVEHCRHRMEEHADDSVMRVAYLRALIEAAEDLDFDVDEFVRHPGRGSDLTGQEDRDEVYGLACRAYLETQAITERVIRDYDAQIPVHFSPAMERVPHLARLVAGTPLGPGQFAHDYFFYGDGRDFDLPDDLNPLACVAFNHQGTKFVKSAAEPYPKGYSFTLARRHMNSLLVEFEEASDEEGVPVPDTLIADVMAMDAAAELFLHDITERDVGSLIELATNTGIADAALMAMLDVLMFHDEQVGRLLAPNAILDLRLATVDQVAAIISTGEQVGLENAALRRLVVSLGHDPDTLGLGNDLPSGHIAQTLVQAALNAGFPDDAVANLARTFGVEFDPASGSWLRADGPDDQ